MSLPLRPRWVYDDGQPVDYTMRLPQRPFDLGSRALGGSDVSAAGIPAAFEIRRDQLMHQTLRFYEHEWADVERLVRHMQRGGSVTMYTDALAGSSDTVYGEAPAMGEEILPRRADDHRMLELDIVVRKVSDSVIARRYYDPVLFSFRATAFGEYTHTRTGTAYYIDEHGVLQSAAADTPRVSWPEVNGVRVPAYLGERASTNLITSDDISAWSTSGSPAVTGSIDDPAGGTGAYTVADDATGSIETVVRTAAFTGDGTKAVLYVVRENTMPASGVQRLSLRDQSASTNRLALDISAWVGGEPTVTASTGTLLGTRYIGNGYWAVAGQAESVVAANTNQVSIAPAVTTAETGSIDVYRVNAFNATVAPAMPLDASGTTGDDFLQLPIGFSPADIEARGGATILTEWVEGGTAFTGSFSRYWQIGGSGASDDPRLLLNGTDTTGSVQAQFDDGTSGAFSTATGVLSGTGQLIRSRVVIDFSGGSWRIRNHVSVAGGAETSASASTIGSSLPSTWSANTLTIGADPSGANEGVAEFLRIVGAGGVRSLTEMVRL